MAKKQTIDMDMIRNVIGLIGLILMAIWTMHVYGYLTITTYITIQYFAVLGAGSIVVWGLYEMATTGSYDGIFNVIALATTVSAGILVWLGYYEMAITPLHVLITTVAAGGWFIAEVIRD